MRSDQVRHTLAGLEQRGSRDPALLPRVTLGRGAGSGTVEALATQELALLDAWSLPRDVLTKYSPIGNC